MPSTIDNEGHFKFLLSCIKHSTAGKVNFSAVADELSIVSKAAAAKRYERLLKSHDISPSSPRKAAAASKDKGDEDADSEAKAAPKAPAGRKRKRENAAATVKDDEDEDVPVKKEKRRRVKKETGVKKEEDSDEDVRVKGEGSSNGSSKRDARDTEDCDLYAIPEAFPRPSRSDELVRSSAEDDADDFCVVTGERPVRASVPHLSPTSFGHGAQSMSNRGHGYANFGSAQQDLTWSNSLGPSNRDVFITGPSSVDHRNWSISPHSVGALPGSR